MKKLFSILAIFIFVLSTFSYADTNNKFVTIRKEKIDNSEESKIIISLSELNKGILGMQGTLEYDKDKIEITNTKVLNENYLLTAFNKETGIFLIEIIDEGFYDESKQLKNGDLLEISIKNNNKSNIELKNIKIVNNDETIECEDVSLNNKNNIAIVICGIILIIVIIIFLLKNFINKKSKNK